MVCVALESLLHSCIFVVWGELSLFVVGYNKLTGKNDSALAELFAEVDQATAEFAPVLKLPVPKMGLVQYLSGPSV
jgi:hypothetical protein